MPEELKPKEIKPAEPVKIALPKEFIRKKSGIPKLLAYALIILFVFFGLSFLFAYFGILKLGKKQLLVNQQITQERQTRIEASSVFDSDGDGLTDEEEKTLGTNVNLVDSDQDDLFDYEEVKVYQTDPLNPDTDNDGYSDGNEVKAGYNPKDPTKGAKLLDLLKEIEKSK